MDFAAIPLFNIMKSKLEVLSERQSVLAQNIANADTPGYKAKDIQEPDFKKMLGSSNGGSAQNLPQTLAMAITNPNHIAATQAAGNYQVIKTKITGEQTPDGNNVVVEDEVAKMATNQAEYQKVLNLYSKAMSMFRTAIGNSSGGA